MLQTHIPLPIPATRRGFSTFELTIAAMLLAIVFASLGPMLSAIRGQRRLADSRQQASLTLANIAEQISLSPYPELTAEAIRQVELPDDIAAALPEAVLTTELTEESDPVGKRVTLSLSWQSDGARPANPLRLVFWRYPDTRRTP
ncbi:MAG: hypothetical protein KDA75_09705 [Planctomycetaceae bacterium]|nr:hypothetical protein [Planctomycetaceae bacterium]